MAGGERGDHDPNRSVTRLIVLKLVAIAVAAGVALMYVWVFGSSR